MRVFVIYNFSLRRERRERLLASALGNACQSARFIFVNKLPKAWIQVRFSPGTRPPAPSRLWPNVPLIHKFQEFMNTFSGVINCRNVLVPQHPLLIARPVTFSLGGIRYSARQSLGQHALPVAMLTNGLLSVVAADEVSR